MARDPTRRDPFAELDFYTGWNPFREYGLIPARWGRLLAEPGRAISTAGFAPSVDISEDEDRFIVTVELPGSKREDISVEMKDHVLTVRGEKRREREVKSERSHLIERRYGSFSRSFTLPANAVGERVKAEFRDGVLTIEVPKAEEARPKAIAIQ
jgi:HSP20 family protein